MFSYPSGREVVTQGYERYALQLLVDQGYDEHDILTNRKDVPEIWYFDSNFVVRRYFVDIFIPKENRVIEVKSSWTARIDVDKIERKLQPCVNAGLVTDIWTICPKGKIIEDRRVCEN